ncbi:unnamed protein product [Rotaria socialis]
MNHIFFKAEDRTKKSHHSFPLIFYYRSQLCCRFVCRACLAARVTLTNRVQLFFSLFINRFVITYYS